MPMAGRGSRFRRGGVSVPKPLIELAGRPFFWWAAESVRRMAPVAEMVFVVLEEHVRDFAIDRAVRAFYPDAQVEILPEVTAGAAETAARGVSRVSDGHPVAICDSDHAFAAEPGAVAALAAADAALLCFRSRDPAYSYVRFDEAGEVAGTIEKRAVSPLAIAGCYLFSSRDAFLEPYARYRTDCPYSEYFVSGVYDALIGMGARVAARPLRRHLSFGTPEELAALLQDGNPVDPWAEAA
jgi:dTDP-glucose pyrophosphorylase